MLTDPKCLRLAEKIVAIVEEHGTTKLAATFNRPQPSYYVSQGNVRDYTHGVYVDMSKEDPALGMTIGFVNNTNLEPLADYFPAGGILFKQRISESTGERRIQELHDELLAYSRFNL